MPLQTRTHRPRRVASAIGVALAGLLALTACFGSGPLQLETEELAAPEWLVPRQAQVGVNAFLPAAGDLPAVFVGTIDEPGEPLVGVVWEVDAGGALAERRLPAMGDRFAPAASASSELAVIAAQVWDDGARRLQLLESDDRRAWNAVPLDDAIAEDYPWVSASAVDGTTAYVIGTSVDGRSIGLRVVDGLVEVFALPGVDGLLRVDELAAADERLVLIARPGPEGASPTPVVYVSEDGGATWNEGEPLADADSRTTTSSLVAVAGGFVVTGAVHIPDGRGYDQVPAAWWSADGIEWLDEEVPLSPVGRFGQPYGVSIGLGSARATAAGLAAVAYDGAADSSAVYTRSDDGTWTQIGTTGRISQVGAGGFAALQEDGSIRAMIGSAAGYHWGTMASNGEWTELEVLSQRESIAVVSEMSPSAAGLELVATTSHFEQNGEGWRTYTTVAAARVDDTGTTPQEWTPEGLGRMTTVRIAANGVGDELRVGTEFIDSDILVRTWVRTDGAADWVFGLGLPVAGAAGVAGVAGLGDRWVIYGGMRPDAGPGAVSQAMILTSEDGRQWRTADGDFADDDRRSGVTGVCELADGRVIAVGWVEQEDWTNRAAAWEADASGWWHRADIGVLGQVDGWASGCASGADGLVIGARTEGRSVIAHSTDGFDWAEVLRMDHGNSIGVPVPVPGGFAAPGEHTGEGLTGPAVWLSKDGREWFPALVPSRAPGETLAVAPLGDDLVVAQSGRIGAPLLLVRDIAKVIAR